MMRNEMRSVMLSSLQDKLMAIVISRVHMEFHCNTLQNLEKINVCTGLDININGRLLFRLIKSGDIPSVMKHLTSKVLSNEEAYDSIVNRSIIVRDMCDKESLRKLDALLNIYKGE